MGGGSGLRRVCEALVPEPGGDVYHKITIHVEGAEIVFGHCWYPSCEYSAASVKMVAALAEKFKKLGILVIPHMMEQEVMHAFGIKIAP